MRRPFAGVPFSNGNEVALGVGGRAGGRIEEGLVGRASADGGLHGIVDGEDGVLGAITAIHGHHECITYHCRGGNASAKGEETGMKRETSEI